jgi:RNA polymerase sigma factor (sigma-70 family)
MGPHKSSLSDFFAKEGRKLSAFVRHRIDDAAEMDAEDLVQDVFANLLEKTDPLAEIQNLSAYVYRSLRNRVIDRLRARKPTTSFDAAQGDGLSLAEILPHPDGTPFDHLAELQREAAFARAFDSLSDSEKRLIQANEFEGRTFQDLSREWEVPLGTLLARKSRAVKRLSSALAEHKPHR